MAKAVDEREEAGRGASHDPREQREARLAKALRDNLRRRKTGAAAAALKDEPSGR